MASGWAAETELEFQLEPGGKIVSVRLEPDGGGYRATVEEREYAAAIVRARPGEIVFRLGERTVTAHVAVDGARHWVSIEGQTFVLARPAPPARRSRGRRGHMGPSDGEALRADMPGLVRSVQAAEGQPVQAGKTLLVLEAMKMEIRVTAPHAGRVRRILVSEGQVVERRQTLVELDEY